MTTAYDTSVLQRAKALQSPIVKELCTYIDELNAREVELNTREAELTATLKAERDAYALLSDANADLAKDNRALRAELTAALQDAKDARHDADQCLKELNRREDGGVPYRF